MRSYENGTMKKCSKCNSCYCKPDITFHKDKNKKDGFRHYCIICE